MIDPQKLDDLLFDTINKSVQSSFPNESLRTRALAAVRLTGELNALLTSVFKDAAKREAAKAAAEARWAKPEPDAPQEVAKPAEPAPAKRSRGRPRKADVSSARTPTPAEPAQVVPPLVPLPPLAEKLAAEGEPVPVPVAPPPPFPTVEQMAVPAPLPPMPSASQPTANPFGTV